LIQLRRTHPVFRRRRWFFGRKIRGEIDLGWFRPDGEQMSDQDWEAGFAKAVGVFLNGEAINSPNARGQRVVDDSFLVLFNAHHEPLHWRLPNNFATQWLPVLDTADAALTEGGRPAVGAGQAYVTEGRSIVVMRRVK
jgi:glycogen operon protein